jgi:hypothetical protein
MHHKVADVGKWLASVLRGHYQYYGVPRNVRKLNNFREAVRRLWHRTLNRRSQKGYITESRMSQWVALASASAYLSSLPIRAIGRDDPRQEPGAVVPLAGICAGGGGRPPSLPRR